MLWDEDHEEIPIEAFPVRHHHLTIVAWPPGQPATGYTVDVWARTSELAELEGERAVRELHGAGTDVDVVDAMPPWRSWDDEVRELAELERDLSPYEMRLAMAEQGEPTRVVPWPDAEQDEYRSQNS